MQQEEAEWAILINLVFSGQPPFMGVILKVYFGPH
jgi:hypothetical protein